MGEWRAAAGGGLSRRALLRAGGLGVASMAMSGCSVLARTAGVGDAVRMSVAWSAGELEAFRAVLAGFRHDYDLLPLGDDIAAALGARTAGRPDLVAKPQPGTVYTSADDLEPLPDDLWHSEYKRIAGSDTPHYALPFKLAHSSVVWYRKRLFAEHGLQRPTTWEEWIALNQRIINDPDLGGAGIAPLALGGADGWLLAVSFDNFLLRHFEGTYKELSGRSYDPGLWGGSDVEQALYMLASMWAMPGAVSGGLDRALVLQFPDAVQETFLYERAAMVVAPDYAESVIRRFGTPPEEFATFTFPARAGASAPLVVAGDLLVVVKPARPVAFELLRYLASPAAPIPWIRDTGGFIAANPGTDDSYYSATLRPLAHEVRDQEISFGLADVLGPVGGREGLQLVLQQLMRSLADGVPPATVARQAARRMVTIARDAR